MVKVNRALKEYEITKEKPSHIDTRLLKGFYVTNKFELEDHDTSKNARDHAKKFNYARTNYKDSPLMKMIDRWERKKREKTAENIFEL